MVSDLASASWLAFDSLGVTLFPWLWLGCLWIPGTHSPVLLGGVLWLIGNMVVFQMKSPVMESYLYVEFVCMTQCTKFLEKLGRRIWWLISGNDLYLLLVLRHQSCQTFATVCILVHQALLSKEFLRQEYWHGLQCPSPGHFSTQDRTCISSIKWCRVFRSPHLLSHLAFCHSSEVKIIPHIFITCSSYAKWCGLSPKVG